MSFKPRLLFYLICFAVTNVFGQAPVITHVDKLVNGNGQRVTISGSNFGINPADLVVWFGAAKGTIETVSDQTIEATVPPGSTYESIVVTNTSTGKSAWSKAEFMLSYGGEQPIALSNLVAQADLAAETGLFDICLCDLDGDGKNDIAATNSGGTVAPPFGVTIYRNNTAAPGTFAFDAKTSFLASTRTLNVKCGDLDGDGKKELIVTESDPGNRVFILKNASASGSLSFTVQNIPLAGKSPKRVETADLDSDGLPELIVTDQNTNNKDLLILPNTSSGATISFGTPTTLTLPVTGNTGSDGLSVQDMDGDNKLDIVVSQVLSSSGNVFVYKNESRLGNFIFTKIVKADIAPGNPNDTGAPMNIRVGDIDGDSKPDIVVTQFLAAKISILLNQSTPTTMQFVPPVSIATDVFPFGLDLGDIDGDGKLDITVASLTGPVTETNPKSLTILNNTSSPGSVSFLAKLTQTTQFINRHIIIGDIDGDAKPDITYTSVDDNTRGVPASKISFFRNKSCIKPVVTPGGSLIVCTGFPLTLQGPISAGATYQWKEAGNNIPAATNPSFIASLAGVYTLEVTSDGCVKTSNAVTITLAVGSVTGLSVTSNTPICVDGTINLNATSTGGTEYNWTGPGGFTATGTSVTRPSYKPEFAGRYEVEVKAGGCIAAKGYTLVETISLPAFNVNFTGSDVICAGDDKLLSVSPNPANFTYQWTNNNTDIGGATSATFNANATGSYSFKAKSTVYPGCPEIKADAVALLVATPPGINFTIPAETCKDTQVTFTNTSTVQADAGPTYKWEFGDATTSTDLSPLHTYTALGDKTVKLTVAYRGDACAGSKTDVIKVSALPTATITAPNSIFKFCAGDKLTLSVTPNFSEYLWSTTATTPTVDVTAGGNYSVQLKNSIGCKITVNKDVTMLPAAVVTATATPNPIDLGQSTELAATAGFASYEWSPSETLDSSEDPSPKATPQTTTTYTVTVVNNDGCTGEAVIEVKVNVDNPSNLLKPSNFFSPNADDTNPVWEVGNILNFPQCAVTIFDEKGLKVFEAKPYLNDWDGTNGGKRLPDGVYYYMIRCDGDSGSKTGSITILR